MFTIPKRPSYLCVEQLTEDNASHKELKSRILSGLFHYRKASCFNITSIHEVFCPSLQRKYNITKKAWKERGYQEDSLLDYYGYIDVSNEDPKIVKLVCEHGIKVGNIPKSVLGDPMKAVQLSRHADVVQTDRKHKYSRILLMFKLMKGRVKVVGERDEGADGISREPTYQYDTHICNETGGHRSFLNFHLAKMWYLYQYTKDDKLARRPTQVCPVAIVQVEFSDVDFRDMVLLPSSKRFSIHDFSKLCKGDDTNKSSNHSDTKESSAVISTTVKALQHHDSSAPLSPASSETRSASDTGTDMDCIDSDSFEPISMIRNLPEEVQVTSSTGEAEEINISVAEDSFISFSDESSSASLSPAVKMFNPMKYCGNSKAAIPPSQSALVNLNFEMCESRTSRSKRSTPELSRSPSISHMPSDDQIEKRKRLFSLDHDYVACVDHSLSYSHTACDEELQMDVQLLQPTSSERLYQSVASTTVTTSETEYENSDEERRPHEVEACSITCDDTDSLPADSAVTASIQDQHSYDATYDSFTSEHHDDLNVSDSPQEDVSLYEVSQLQGGACGIVIKKSSNQVKQSVVLESKAKNVTHHKDTYKSTHNKKRASKYEVKGKRSSAATIKKKKHASNNKRGTLSVYQDKAIKPARKPRSFSSGRRRSLALLENKSWFCNVITPGDDILGDPISKMELVKLESRKVVNITKELDRMYERIKGSNALENTLINLPDFFSWPKKKDTKSKSTTKSELPDCVNQKKAKNSEFTSLKLPSQSSCDENSTVHDSCKTQSDAHKNTGAPTLPTRLPHVTSTTCDTSSASRNDGNDKSLHTGITTASRNKTPIVNQLKENFNVKPTDNQRQSISSQPNVSSQPPSTDPKQSHVTKHEADIKESQSVTLKPKPMLKIDAEKFKSKLSKIILSTATDRLDAQETPPADSGNQIISSTSVKQEPDQTNKKSQTSLRSVTSSECGLTSQVESKDMKPTATSTEALAIRAEVPITLAEEYYSKDIQIGKLSVDSSSVKPHKESNMTGVSPANEYQTADNLHSNDKWNKDAEGTKADNSLQRKENKKKKKQERESSKKLKTKKRTKTKISSSIADKSQETGRHASSSFPSSTESPAKTKDSTKVKSDFSESLALKSVTEEVTASPRKSPSSDVSLSEDSKVKSERKRSKSHSRDIPCPNSTEKQKNQKKKLYDQLETKKHKSAKDEATISTEKDNSNSALSTGIVLDIIAKVKSAGSKVQPKPQEEVDIFASIRDSLKSNTGKKSVKRKRINSISKENSLDPVKKSVICEELKSSSAKYDNKIVKKKKSASVSFGLDKNTIHLLSPSCGRYVPFSTPVKQTTPMPPATDETCTNSDKALAKADMNKLKLILSHPLTVSERHTKEYSHQRADFSPKPPPQQGVSPAKPYTSSAPTPAEPDLYGPWSPISPPASSDHQPSPAMQSSLLMSDTKSNDKHKIPDKTHNSCQRNLFNDNRECEEATHHSAMLYSNENQSGKAFEDSPPESQRKDNNIMPKDPFQCNEEVVSFSHYLQEMDNVWSKYAQSHVSTASLYRDRLDLSHQSFSQSFNNTMNGSAIQEGSQEVDDMINNLEKMLERLNLSDSYLDVKTEPPHVSNPHIKVLPSESDSSPQRNTPTADAAFCSNSTAHKEPSPLKERTIPTTLPVSITLSLLPVSVAQKEEQNSTTAETEDAEKKPTKPIEVAMKPSVGRREEFWDRCPLESSCSCIHVQQCKTIGKPGSGYSDIIELETMRLALHNKPESLTEHKVSMEYSESLYRHLGWQKNLRSIEQSMRRYSNLEAALSDGVNTVDKNIELEHMKITLVKNAKPHPKETNHTRPASTQEEVTPVDSRAHKDHNATCTGETRTKALGDKLKPVTYTRDKNYNPARRWDSQANNSQDKLNLDKHASKSMDHSRHSSREPRDRRNSEDRSYRYKKADVWTRSESLSRTRTERGRRDDRSQGRKQVHYGSRSPSPAFESHRAKSSEGKRQSRSSSSKEPLTKKYEPAPPPVSGTKSAIKNANHVPLGATSNDSPLGSVESKILSAIKQTSKVASTSSRVKSIFDRLSDIAKDRTDSKCDMASQATPDATDSDTAIKSKYIQKTDLNVVFEERSSSCLPAPRNQSIQIRIVDRTKVGPYESVTSQNKNTSLSRSSSATGPTTPPITGKSDDIKTIEGKTKTAEPGFKKENKSLNKNEVTRKCSGSYQSKENSENIQPVRKDHLENSSDRRKNEVYVLGAKKFSVLRNLAETDCPANNNLRFNPYRRFTEKDCENFTSVVHHLDLLSSRNDLKRLYLNNSKSLYRKSNKTRQPPAYDIGVSRFRGQGLGLVRKHADEYRRRAQVDAEEYWAKRAADGSSKVPEIKC